MGHHPSTIGYWVQYSMVLKSEIAALHRKIKALNNERAEMCEEMREYRANRNRLVKPVSIMLVGRGGGK